MNRLVSLLAFICLTSFTYTCARGTSQGAAVHTLVIDPGHGGMDPGAIGPGGHHEADLALAVSLKFGQMVKEAFPDVKIIYTRTTDKFVSLADRADMANKAKADLFVCIHLNSAVSKDAYGTSTYVLGLHRTDDNLEIAKRENAVIELEGDRDRNYEFDPNSPEGHIIMSMKQNAFLDQSILIASKIEDELAMLSKRKSRGVKQAGFWVLYKTAMPSLLAEIGFISNPLEEQYLATEPGEANIALSLFKAFRSYKYEIEGIKDTDATANQPLSQKKTEATQAPAPQAIAQVNTPPQNEQPKSKAISLESIQPANKVPEPIAPVPVAIVKSIDTPKAELKTIAKVEVVSIDTQSIIKQGKVDIQPENTKPKTEIKPVIKEENPVLPQNTEPVAFTPPVTPVKEEPVKVVDKITKTETPVKPTLVPATVKAEVKPVKQPEVHATKPQGELVKTVQLTGKEDIYFTVQLFAAKHKPANYDEIVNKFGLVDREEIQDGLVRYMAGEFPNFTEAKKALEIAHSMGIKDAFIVGYINKKRLTGTATMQLGQKFP